MNTWESYVEAERQLTAITAEVEGISAALRRLIGAPLTADAIGDLHRSLKLQTAFLASLTTRLQQIEAAETHRRLTNPDTETPCLIAHP